MTLSWIFEMVKSFFSFIIETFAGSSDTSSEKTIQEDKSFVASFSTSVVETLRSDAFLLATNIKSLVSEYETEKFGGAVPVTSLHLFNLQPPSAGK